MILADFSLLRRRRDLRLLLFGFTVSIFITDLAFGGTSLADQAKIAILAASALAAVIGSALILTMTRRQATWG